MEKLPLLHYSPSNLRQWTSSGTNAAWMNVVWLHDVQDAAQPPGEMREAVLEASAAWQGDVSRQNSIRASIVC